jgi:hypothetical protein
MERDIRPIGLATIGDLVGGRASAQFEAAFSAALEAARSPEAQRDGSGWAKATITVTVTVEARSADDGGTAAIGVEIVAKNPRLRASGAQLVDLDRGEVGVDFTERQAPLFDRPRVAEQQ